MNTSPVKGESPQDSNKSNQPAFLTLPDGRRLAYVLSEGASPGVVFLSGFKSDMTGTKAAAVEAFCRARGQRCVRFDYTGHGQSSGVFTDGTIGDWKRDTIDIIDHIAPGKNILVGSSMGGWVMLLAALARKEHIAGLVGIASAPDFTETLLWDIATDAQKKELQEKGVTAAPSCSGEEAYPITLRLIEEGRNHLLLKQAIALDVPVRLLHGMMDEDVPWEVSVKLAQSLTSRDVQLTLVKDAGHRLSEPEHLALLMRAIEDVLSKA